MKWPESLAALVDYGIVDEVLRPLMSGKEAEVYLVLCGGEERVAKVYKEAQERSFRQRADYTEGRRTRNSRDQRAVQKRTRHGRAQDEAAWRVAEVERIHRLRNAGVRVPEPHEFVDGVLVMELVQDAEGHPAPRLGDLTFSATEAMAIYDTLIREVVRMLAADLVHGDLSEFNVLMGVDGPVIIDFPQSVDPASNRNARTLLLRDVENLHRFLKRHAPGRKTRRLGEEMWQLYEAGKLKPDTVLRGTFKNASGPTDTGAVMELIDDARRDAERARGADDDLDVDEPVPSLRRVVDFTKDRSDRAKTSRGARSGTSAKPRSGERRGGAANSKGSTGRKAGSSGEKESGGRSARSRGSKRPGRGSAQRSDADRSEARTPRPARGDGSGTRAARPSKRRRSESQGSESPRSESQPKGRAAAQRPEGARRRSADARRDRSGPSSATKKNPVASKNGGRPSAEPGEGPARRRRGRRRRSGGGHGSQETAPAGARSGSGGAKPAGDRHPAPADGTGATRKRSRRRRRPSGRGSDGDQTR